MIVAIGDPVSGGTAGYVLFVDVSGNLGQSSGLTFDASHGTLVVVSDGSHSAGSFTCGVFSAVLASPSGSVFADNTHGAVICDATYAFNVTAGSINTLGTTGNTYRWGAGHAASGTAIATPDNWVLININGTDYLLPAYLP